jgi:hypothetical protein
MTISSGTITMAAGVRRYQFFLRKAVFMKCHAGRN